MRGVLHQVSFFIALAAGISLTSQVPEGFRWGTVVYVLSLTGLLGISALYHRPLWSPAVRQWLRRADHAAIVLLIAGTATPIGSPVSLERPEGMSSENTSPAAFHTPSLIRVALVPRPRPVW